MVFCSMAVLTQSQATCRVEDKLPRVASVKNAVVVIEGIPMYVDFRTGLSRELLAGRLDSGGAYYELRLRGPGFLKALRATPICASDGTYPDVRSETGGDDWRIRITVLDGDATVAVIFVGMGGHASSDGCVCDSGDWFRRVWASIEQDIAPLRRR
ncbi:MAG: hypothetical protein Kow0062_25220 [Acidobacteriota bacterium]